MKLLVSAPHFQLKRLRGINNDKNTITQIREKTTNATQNQTGLWKVILNTNRRLKVKTETE